MQQIPWHDFGGEGPLLQFMHANGYPAPCYRRFIAELTPHYHVQAPDQRPLWPHRPRPPGRRIWRQLASDMIHYLEQRGAGPVIAMGHSLGAVVSLYAAHQRPELFRGLVLLDPVFLLPHKVLTWGMMPMAMRRRIKFIHRTLGRPVHFPDARAAWDFHRGKRAYRGFSDEALWDFVHGATEDDGSGGLRLRFPPAWEAAVYCEMPAVWRELRRCRVPVVGIRGASSDTLMTDAWRRWANLRPADQLAQIEGLGHLFPLEDPCRAAGLVHAQIQELLDR